MPDDRRITIPTQLSIAEYRGLRELVLSALRKQTGISRPINVCMYVAVPSEKWNFSREGKIELSDGSLTAELVTELWVFNDPDVAYLIPNAAVAYTTEAVQKATALVRIPRPIQVAGHWKNCPMVLGENPLSPRTDAQSLNSRVEFSYRLATDLNATLASCGDVLETSPDATLNQFKALNELDDYFLAAQDQVQSLCFARIPYLSVPTAFVALPRTSSEELDPIVERLHEIHTSTQPSLSMYVPALIQILSRHYADKAKSEYWMTNASERMIATILGLAVASVLFPDELTVEADWLDEPIRFKLHSNQRPAGYEHCDESFPLRLQSDKAKEFSLRVKFFDYENLFLSSLTDVKKHWNASTAIASRSSKSLAYQFQRKLFHFALQEAVSMLQGHATLRRAENHLRYVRKTIGHLEESISEWRNRLQKVDNLQLAPVWFDRIRDLSHKVYEAGGRLITFLTSEGRLLSDAHNHFDNFIVNCRQYDDPTQSFSHILRSRPEASGDFCVGVGSAVEWALTEIEVDHARARNLSREFQVWMRHEVRFPTSGGERRWPISVSPDSRIAQDVVKAAFLDVWLDKGFEVDINLGSTGWRIDLPMLCYLAAALFNRKERNPIPDSIKVTYQESTWVMSWQLDSNGDDVKGFTFDEKAKEVERDIETADLGPGRLSGRIWFLRRSLGFVDGKLSASTNNGYTTITMTWTTTETRPVQANAVHHS